MAKVAGEPGLGLAVFRAKARVVNLARGDDVFVIRLACRSEARPGVGAVDGAELPGDLLLDRLRVRVVPLLVVGAQRCSGAAVRPRQGFPLARWS